MCKIIGKWRISFVTDTIYRDNFDIRPISSVAYRAERTGILCPRCWNQYVEAIVERRNGAFYGPRCRQTIAFKCQGNQSPCERQVPTACVLPSRKLVPCILNSMTCCPAASRHGIYRLPVNLAIASRRR